MAFSIIDVITDKYMCLGCEWTYSYSKPIMSCDSAHTESDQHLFEPFYQADCFLFEQNVNKHLSDLLDATRQDLRRAVHGAQQLSCKVLLSRFARFRRNIPKNCKPQKCYLMPMQWLLCIWCQACPKCPTMSHHVPPCPTSSHNGKAR